MPIKKRCKCPVCDTERPAIAGANGRLTLAPHRPPLKKEGVEWLMRSDGECKGSGIEVAEEEVGSLLYAIIHEIVDRFHTRYFPL